MPELPEVETIARGLARRVSGDVIDSIWLGQKPEPLKSPAREIAAALEHSRISTVRRMGKHIVFDLENKSVRSPKTRPTQAQWIVHLGMTGRLQVCEPQAEILKHTHAILKLKSGRELRFVDPRRFGRLSVARAGNFEADGIEPLEADLDRFLPLFRGRKTPIKSALLNQKLLRGVGNIYADESLFRAGIRPRRRHYPRPASQTARVGERGSPGSDRSRRLVHLRLCRRRRRRRFLPAATPRLRPRRRALPGLQDAHQTYRDCRPQQPLLPRVPEVTERLGSAVPCRT
jgi:formamidopyrimidine-DNA glycosylase